MDNGAIDAVQGIFELVTAEFTAAAAAIPAGGVWTGLSAEARGRLALGVAGPGARLGRLLDGLQAELDSVAGSETSAADMAAATAAATADAARQRAVNAALRALLDEAAAAAAAASAATAAARRAVTGEPCSEDDAVMATSGGGGGGGAGLRSG